MNLNKRRVVVALVVVVLFLAAFAPPAVRYIGGFMAAEDSFVLWGYDIRFYDGRQFGSNQTIRLDGAAGAARLVAPTAVGTATPVIVADSSGVSNLIEARYNATPVFSVDTSGAVNLQGGLSTATGAFTVTDTLQVTGAADIDGALTFGSTPLYPLGYSITGQEIVCGTTAVFTGSTTIDVTDLTTATYVVATQVTAPISTAAYLHASDPSTTTITLTSLGNGFAAGTTGISAHYCVIGDD